MARCKCLRLTDYVRIVWAVVTSSYNVKRKECQKSHHTLLHDSKTPSEEISVGSNTATSLKSDVLLMTCRVLITAPDGSSVEARALLDNASFISERLVHSLALPRTSQSIRVSGIGGMSHKPPIQSITKSNELERR